MTGQQTTVELQRLTEKGLDENEWETLNTYADSEQGHKEATNGLELANRMLTQPARLRVVRLVGSEEFLIATNHVT
jgi:hypothetical protein